MIEKIFVLLGLKINHKIDQQSSLFRLGRDEYKYCEGDRCVVFQIEILEGVPQRLIYKSTIKKWLPPFDKIDVSEQDKDRITEKIRDYWQSAGLSVVVQD